MTVRAVHPNPLIQALQLAGADWAWPGETLSVFWRTTADTMAMAGWAGYSNPWDWRDVHAAHLRRLGAESIAGISDDPTFRLEACIAVWLRDGHELRQHLGAVKALRDVYLPRLNALSLDEEAALCWAALLDFGVDNTGTPVSRLLAAWMASSPNSMRWVHAHQVVYPFGMELWPTARHMHRIVNNVDVLGEAASLEGLLV